MGRLPGTLRLAFVELSLCSQGPCAPRGLQRAFAWPRALRGSVVAAPGGGSAAFTKRAALLVGLVSRPTGDFAPRETC